MHVPTNEPSSMKEALGQGRLACPGCHHPIPLRLADLLQARPVWCSGCGGKLTVNREASERALNLWSSFRDDVLAKQKTA